MHYLLVSIHAPREGCDAASMAAIIALCGFQFTHPGRGATNSGCSKFELLTVSIHAPREGCDSSVTLCREVQLLFQFTHPGRGATVEHRYILRIIDRFNSRTPGGVRR